MLFEMDKTSHFNQLLQAARAQPEPQRLLFVFATADLPDDATPAQRQRFEAGGGGALAPLMCVDKGLDELASFDQLVAQSRETGPAWQVVFAAGLSGRNGRPPQPQVIDQALQAMVEGVRGGMIESFLALDHAGEVVHIERASCDLAIIEVKTPPVPLGSRDDGSD
jgi:hypothetical protein